MTDPRHDLGLRAEAAVADWLRAAGWRILARRRRSLAGGEVDLVALDPRGVLVAVEVRARQTSRAGSAAGSVDRRRIGRLERTLIEYASRERVPHDGLRVDLVTVEPDGRSGAPGRHGPGWRVVRHPGVGSW